MMRSVFSILSLFVLLAAWQIKNGLATDADDSLADDMRIEITRKLVPLRVALVSLAIGFVVLVISSRMLVWGAVEIALALGLMGRSAVATDLRRSSARRLSSR